MELDTLILPYLKGVPPLTNCELRLVGAELHALVSKIPSRNVIVILDSGGMQPFWIAYE